MRGPIICILTVLLVAAAGCDGNKNSAATTGGERKVAPEQRASAAPPAETRPPLWLHPMSTGEYAAEYNAASTAAPGAIPNPYAAAQGGAAPSPTASFTPGAAPGTGTADAFVSETYISEPYVQYATPAPVLVGAAPYPVTNQPRSRSPYDPLFNGGAAPLPPPAPVPYVVAPGAVIAPVQPAPVIMQPAPAVPLEIVPVTDPLSVSVYTDTVSPAPLTGAPAGETVISRAVGGMQLVPAPDVPPGIHPNDAAPSQWFEIIRPDNGPIRIGRVSATCVCVGVRVPKRQIAAGERALIEARTLSRPPRNNLTYGIYVNIAEPARAVLDADVTIRY